MAATTTKENPEMIPRTTALAAVLGGAAYAFIGAISATHGDFGGTHNTIDSTSEYLVTGGFGLALLALAPVYLALGRLAGTPHAGWGAAAPQALLGAMSLASVVQGEDPGVFNAVAPLCLLAWLAASVLIARGMRRAGAPRALAIALPLLLVAAIPLAPVGGQLVMGAFWLVAGGRALRGEQGVLVPRPAVG